MRKATNLCKPSLMELRLKPDWNAAAPLYEQAMTAYKAKQSTLTSGWNCAPGWEALGQGESGM